MTLHAMPKPVDSGRHQLPRVMARIAITMGETKSMMQYVQIHSTKYRQTHACKTNIPNKYNIDDQRSFVRRQSTIDDRISPLIQTHCLVLGSMLQATYANFGGVSKMGSSYFDMPGTSQDTTNFPDVSFEVSTTLPKQNRAFSPRYIDVLKGRIKL